MPVRSAGTLKFRLLGAVGVSRGGQDLAIPAAKQRAVLALLLLRANSHAGLADLVAGVWGDTPPDTAERLIRTYVWRLRSVLAGVGCAPATDPDSAPGAIPESPSPTASRLASANGGYRLVVSPDEFDVFEFAELVERARQAREAGDRAAAVAALTAALALWRGDPLADVRVHGPFTSELRRLAEERESALDEWGDLTLELGQHDALVPRLTALVDAGPLREHRVAQLMLALYRCGRRTEALAAFTAARLRLVEETGLDPGHTLLALQRAVLTDSAEVLGDGPVRGLARRDMTPAQGAVRPGAVSARVARDGTALVPPPGPDDFVGREAELERATAAISAGGSVVLTGMPGIGKTSLALRLAALVADLFPDGVLFADLRGFDEHHRSVADVLAEFLRLILGPSATLPVEEQVLAAQYRSALAGRRCLVVLDNAADEVQLRPLLAQAPGCASIVTSRTTLAGIDAHCRIAVGPLDTEHAVRLLGLIVGPDRLFAEASGVMELARYCAGLPLALRIAGARLATRPDWRPSALAAQLRLEESRVRRLAAGDRVLAAAFSTSYRMLDPEQRLMFGRLGLVPGPTIGTSAAAVLAGCSSDRAGEMLGELVDASLLLAGPDPDRVALHDLMRLYARGRAAEDAGARTALARLLHWYVAAADAAAGAVAPGMTRMEREAPGQPPVPEFVDARAASAWLRAERATILAVIQSAPRLGLAPVSWQLADAMRGFYYVNRLDQDWLAGAQSGLAAAQAALDRRAEAAMLNSLGLLDGMHGNDDAALAHSSLAAEISRTIGWLTGEAAAVGNMGLVYQRRGLLDEARDCGLRALRINTRAGDLRGQAIQLGNLAGICRKLGRIDEAARLYQRSLTVHEATGNAHGRTLALCNLAGVLLDLDRLDEAAHHCRTARQSAAAIDSPLLDAIACKGLAEALRRQGAVDEALDLARHAVRVARKLHDTTIEADARHVIAAACHQRGEFAAARSQLRRALTIARSANDRANESQALLGLARLWSGRNNRTAARYARRAFDLARRHAFRAHADEAAALLQQAPLSILDSKRDGGLDEP